MDSRIILMPGRLSPTLLPLPRQPAIRALVLLGGLVFLHGFPARRGLRLDQLLVLGRSVDALLEHRLGVVYLELGLEAGRIGGEAAAVRTASSVAQVEALVDDLVARISPSSVLVADTLDKHICIYGKHIPVALSAAVLLGLLGVLSDEAVLGEVARQMLRGSCGAVGETGVVLVVELVRASHCR